MKPLWKSVLVLGACSVSLALGTPAAGQDRGAANAAKAAKAANADRVPVRPGPVDRVKPPRQVRVQAPPKPSVRTAVAPGTWRVHRHKGNSPLFKHGRPDVPVPPVRPGRPDVPGKPDKPGRP